MLLKAGASLYLYFSDGGKERRRARVGQNKKMGVKGRDNARQDKEIFQSFPWVNCLYLLLITKVRIPLGILSQLTPLNLVTECLLHNSFINSCSSTPFSFCFIFLFLGPHIVILFFLLNFFSSPLSCLALFYLFMALSHIFDKNLPRISGPLLSLLAFFHSQCTMF